MDAHATSPFSLADRRYDEPLSRICRTALFVAATLAVVLSLFALVRGTIGDLQAPSTNIGRVLPVLIAATFAALFRVAWNKIHPRGSSTQRLVVQRIVPSICVASICAAMSLSGIGLGTIVLVWLIAIGSELPWWRSAFAVGERESITRDQLNPNSLDQIGANNDRKDEEDEIDPSILQQLTRSTNADNVEIISGVLRAEFVAGDRSRNLHVAFCPPLEYEPHIVVHQLDGVPVDIKVAQTEVFGARIELRLQSSAKENETATVYFEAGPTQKTEA